MRIDVSIPQQYINSYKQFIDLQERLPDILEERHLSINFIASRMKTPYTTLRRKILNKQLTAEELLHIATIVNA